MHKTYITSLQSKGMPQKLRDLIAATLNCSVCAYSPVQRELKQKYSLSSSHPQNYWKEKICKTKKTQKNPTSPT